MQIFIFALSAQPHPSVPFNFQTYRAALMKFTFASKRLFWFFFPTSRILRPRLTFFLWTRTSTSILRRCIILTRVDSDGGKVLVPLISAWVSGNDTKVKRVYKLTNTKILVHNSTHVARAFCWNFTDDKVQNHLAMFPRPPTFEFVHQIILIRLHFVCSCDIFCIFSPRWKMGQGKLRKW